MDRRESEHGSLESVTRAPTHRAGTRWVTERITSPAGEQSASGQKRNDRHERHHGRRPTRSKTKTAFEKKKGWLLEIALPLDRSR